MTTSIRTGISTGLHRWGPPLPIRGRGTLSPWCTHRDPGYPSQRLGRKGFPWKGNQSVVCKWEVEDTRTVVTSSRHSLYFCAVVHGREFLDKFNSCVGARGLSCRPLRLPRLPVHVLFDTRTYSLNRPFVTFRSTKTYDFTNTSKDRKGTLRKDRSWCKDFVSTCHVRGEYINVYLIYL